MAEAFLNEMCPDDFTAQSAGLEPGTLNPLAVAAMREVGIDMAGQRRTRKGSLLTFFKRGDLF